MTNSKTKRTEKFDKLVTRYIANANKAYEERRSYSLSLYYQGILVGIKLSAFDTLSTVEYCKFMDEVHMIDDSFLGWGSQA
jgi:hypothetical protein